MLDIKIIRSDTELVRQALKNRGANIDLDKLLELDNQRRGLVQQSDELKAKRNQFSAEIAKKGKGAQEEIQEMRRISDTIKALDQDIKNLENDINDIVLGIPNIPHESVPIGTSEKDNPEVHVWGEKPNFEFEPKAHWDIGEALGILDFKRAAKITGARFAVEVGAGAKLERALINFMLDVHTNDHGCTEVWTPFMVNRDSMTATGQLPKFEEELFRTDDFFLIPTAEVPVTNMYRDETLSEDDLPIKMVAYTPCFRREAGSYGKDTRGLIRQHQFNKVELVRFTHPERSYQDLEELTADAEDILKRLGLHFRRVCLCTGDMGFSSSKTYDLEVWMPGQGGFREISSCSNFEDFQARRGAIRYKSAKTKKGGLVHTLNGSGLAIGRTLAAILENYQQADGSVKIPDALIPYMGLDQISPIR